MALEHTSEPVVGWRVWNLWDSADGPVLLPAGSGSDAWPWRRPLEARCTVPRLLTDTIASDGQPHHHDPARLASAILRAYEREAPALRRDRVARTA